MTVANSRLPALDAGQRQRIIETLTPGRLSKYLQVTNHNQRLALGLYCRNSTVSAAFFSDIHFLEVALRNKFHIELTAKYGADWFRAAPFLALQNPRTQGILLKAERDAQKHWTPGVVLPAGKVVAELTFGFWLNLTDKRLEHSLWTPCLHKAFASGKVPRRSRLNGDLEKIRQLRNRIAHHEAIFHMDLAGLHQTLTLVTAQLCPDVASLMRRTSSAHHEICALKVYRRRKGI